MPPRVHDERAPALHSTLCADAALHAQRPHQAAGRRICLQSFDRAINLSFHQFAGTRTLNSLRAHSLCHRTRTSQSRLRRPLPCARVGIHRFSSYFVASIFIVRSEGQVNELLLKMMKNRALPNLTQVEDMATISSLIKKFDVLTIC